MAGILAGKRVVITGASRGIGFEIAKRFLSEGADVIGVGRDEARVAKAAERLRLQPPGRFEPLVADLAVPQTRHQIVDAVLSRWAALDILVNNAAILFRAPGEGGFEAEPSGTLEQTLDVNLLAPFRTTMALLPLLEKGTEPRVIHVTSGAGTSEGLAEPGLGSYRLSKWSLNGLTKLMAAQWRGRVAVNALDPGWVKTDMGGREAPRSPLESAEAALSLVLLPWASSGNLYRDGAEISY